MVSVEPTLDQETILIVEDDVGVQKIITEVVSNMGYKALEARTVSSALTILRREKVSLMLLDIMLRGATGIALIKNLIQQNLMVPTIVVSAHLSDTLVQELIGLGINGVVSKPFTFERLTREIRKTLGLDEATEDPSTQNIQKDPEEAIREKRRSPRIPVKLPIKLKGAKDDYMKLVDIGASGMQIHCKNLDMLTGQPKTKVFEFEVRIVANLAWINANPDETMAIGWDFDSRLHPKAEDAETSETPSEKIGIIERVTIPYPILAKPDAGESLQIKIMDMSTTSMRTICTDLEVLKLGPADKPFLFFLPIKARLAWMNTTDNNMFAIGWEFEQPA